MHITAGETLLRLGVSVVLGSAIGYERERTGRPAGLRTHLLVSLASATFMIVSTQFVYFQHYGKDDLIAVDTSRIAASVVSGVGFLGAGAILRTGLSVQGLTTAASLWLVAALGLAAGGGMFLIAVTSTCVALLGLVLLRRVEGRQWRLLQRRITLVLEGGQANARAAADEVRNAGGEVTDVDHEHDLRAGRTRLTLDVRLPDRAALDRLVARLETLPMLRRVKVQRPV
jgi:putative Mg2+ transporter-C (MgtC) family protein